MANINRRPVHHAARDRRHLRRRRLHALDRHGGRHGRAGARRQRLRRRRRHGLHAAGGGAAPVRARRRRAGDALRRQGGQARRRVRPGAGAGGRDHRPLPRPPRPRHRARHRPAAGLRAGHLRDLHDDPARLRHHAAARRAGAGHRLRPQRLSAGRARLLPPSPPSSSSSASTGRPRPPSTCRAARCRRPDSLFTNVRHAETYERILKEAEAGGGGREAEIERARRAWSQGFVAEAIDAFCRTNEVMDVSGRRAQGRAHRAGHGDVAADAARSRSISTTATIACSSRTPGRRARCCCRCWRCSRASTSTSSPPPTPSSSTPGSSAPSSPTPTARPSTAIPKFVDVPMETLLSEAYNAERRKLVGDAGLAWSSAPARSRASAAA